MFFLNAAGSQCEELRLWQRSWGRRLGIHKGALQYSCLENPHGQRSLADYTAHGVTLWWVFAIHWSESATGVRVSPLPEPRLQPPSASHPSGLSQCTGFECPVSRIELRLVIYFTYSNIYVSVLFSQFISSSPSFTVSPSLFFVSASLLLPYK